MIPSASTATHSETRFYLFDVIADLAKMARRSGDWPVAIHLEAILAAERSRDSTRPSSNAEDRPHARALTRGREP